MNIFPDVFNILASHSNRAQILFKQKHTLIIQLHSLQNT